MNYNVFETEAAAIAAQDYDYQSWKSANYDEASSDYWNGTVAWGVIQQRDSDGKWIYPVCPDGDQGHTQEPYSEDWFQWNI